MEGQNHLREMQRYVANVAITPSTFRKLGAGFVEAAQEFLASLNLKQLANLEPSEYPKWLEDQTQALMASFPLAERWGPARKSINIFMVMASLNQFLCDEYKLHRFGYVLEVPLDNTVTKKLRAWGKERNRVRRSSRHSVLSNSKRRTAINTKSLHRPAPRSVASHEDGLISSFGNRNGKGGVSSSPVSA